MRNFVLTDIMVILFFVTCASLAFAQDNSQTAELDRKVRAFLSAHKQSWREMNVPEADGKLLYDIVLKHGYKRALEIGTSTGHSSVWIAWALSKTGGKLITVEIDKARYKAALRNFERAGLSAYIDARLADAHKLVPALEGPFDFVFSDADKDWYRNYFDSVAPKLEVGGCYVTHNVSDRWDSGFGLGSYVTYLKSLGNFETSFNSDGAGVAISYKKSDK